MDRYVSVYGCSGLGQKYVVSPETTVSEMILKAESDQLCCGEQSYDSNSASHPHHSPYGIFDGETVKVLLKMDQTIDSIHTLYIV